MMNRRVPKIAVAVIGVAAMSLAIDSLPRSRTIVLNATGPVGQEVAGFVVVDGARQEISGLLPTAWSFDASKLEFALEQTSPASSEHIRLTMAADEQEIGTVADQAVRGSCRCTGIGPIGSSEFSIGGARTLK